jgi:hypothetical protein
VWSDDGSKSAAARLARDTGMSRSHANAVLRRARRLATMPTVAAAFRDGMLSADVVDLLVAVNVPRRKELFARDEQLLVTACADQDDETSIRHILDRWAQAADDDLGYDPMAREIEGRYLNAARTLNGSVDLRGSLDRVDGTTVINELERLEHDMFTQDWAEARAEHGQDCGADKLARTPGQRRADALVEMAKRSAAMPVDGIAPRPLITVLVGYETFCKTLCELEDGTPLSPRHLLPLLSEADIERVVFDGPSRVLDIGVRQRFFTGALRRALEVRDRHCQHDSGCKTPAAWCQADHIIPYADGGITTQANGRLLCGVHNRARATPRTRDITDGGSLLGRDAFGRPRSSGTT